VAEGCSAFTGTQGVKTDRYSGIAGQTASNNYQTKTDAEDGKVPEAVIKPLNPGPQMGVTPDRKSGRNPESIL
jgi:hypothetical protein